MKVKFVPQNIELEIMPNQSVLQLAIENGIRVKSVCRGMPSCAECRVRVIDGEHNVLPPSEKELSLIGTGHFIDGRRLSCQLLCFGDVTIDLEEQVEKAEAEKHKRPQGNLRKEQAEVSHAVSGNLIQQDESMASITDDTADSDDEAEGGKPERTNKRTNKRTDKSSSRRSGRRPASRSAKPGEKKASDKDGAEKKKKPARSRNRRGNRNRSRSGGDSKPSGESK